MARVARAKDLRPIDPYWGSTHSVMSAALGFSVG